MSARRASISPADDVDDTRSRVMAAAVRCVLRWGVAKTGLADIANEARCSRQTIYNHFPNADAVIGTALLEASYAFADRMVDTIRAYESPEDRVVEAMMFCLNQLPHEPFLQLVGDPTLGKLVSESLFTSETSREVVDRVARVCVENDPSLAERAPELAEVMTRLVLSFLVIREERTRTDDEMRAFLRQWLLPGLFAPRTVASGAPPRSENPRPRRGSASPARGVRK